MKENFLTEVSDPITRGECEQPDAKHTNKGTNNKEAAAVLVFIRKIRNK